MTGPFDGASMNPARRLGPDLAIANLSTWWAHPIAACLTATLIATPVQVTVGLSRLVSLQATPGLLRLRE
jgi:glycerol uptake facilitator-like aquaporin